METYWLTNPSDPYTFKASDLAIAGVVVLLLGHGAYAARTRDARPSPEELSVPFFFGDGSWRPWFAELGTTLEDVLEDRKPELIESLRSVLIGSFSDRKIFEASDIDPELWHDEKRTSMNDIGCHAKAWADKLEE
jgi:hypothetical protein